MPANHCPAASSVKTIPRDTRGSVAPPLVPQTGIDSVVTANQSHSIHTYNELSSLLLAENSNIFSFAISFDRPTISAAGNFRFPGMNRRHSMLQNVTFSKAPSCHHVATPQRYLRGPAHFTTGRHPAKRCDSPGGVTFISILRKTRHSHWHGRPARIFPDGPWTKKGIGEKRG